ncbi:FkbM family methyltransferase [Candidatus Pelagibacter sp.]|nr:FkbM family methyltransferase [Candidatus Pelagibacter sp.]
MKDQKQYTFSQNPLTVIKNIIKYIFFRTATTKSNNLYVRGSDRLSIAPQIEGLHEAAVSNYIKFSATQNNKSDFLIDIGANIGLISCQTGNDFKKVICYEPNPLCCHILKVNTAISLNKLNVKIYEFGLGTQDEDLELWIPKKNWGGAFIRSRDNFYSDDVLAKKDGFINLDKKNYIIENVKVCNGSNNLSELFKDLSSNNLINGVIKIDVEGMEQSILESISKALPKNINVDIIFENWDDNLDFISIKNYFKNRKIVIKELKNIIPYKKTWPKVFKGIAMILSGNFTSLEEIDFNKSTVGDIIINIE